MRTHLLAVAMLVVGGMAVSVSAGDKARNPELRKKLLEKFDKDGDGKLSEEERAAAKAAFQEKHPDAKEKVLAHFDKDGDGKLSEEERAAAKAAHEKHEGKREHRKEKKDDAK